jgi:hypothetical protein
VNPTPNWLVKVRGERMVMEFGASRRPPDVGDIVRINYGIGSFAYGGYQGEKDPAKMNPDFDLKTIYCYGQRGVVIRAGRDTVQVQIIAAPPSHPYHSHLHGQVLRFPRKNLTKLEALPFYRERAKTRLAEAVEKARANEAPAEAEQMALF